MTSFTNAIAAAAAFLLVSPVVAQNRIIVEQGGGAPRPENMVRVQNNISFFMAGPTGDGDEAQKLREKAQRSVYEMAGRQCDLLREVLAKDCRLESVNVQVNATNARQFNQQQTEGLNVNGSMSLQINLK
jgi:hypothetical protein